MAIGKISSQRPRITDDIYNSLTAYHRTPFVLWKRVGNKVEAQLPITSQYIPDTKIEKLPNAPYFVGKIITLAIILLCLVHLESQRIAFKQILTERSN